MAEQTGAAMLTPGTQNLWIQFRNQSNPLYWGTAVTSPEFTEVPHVIEVNNDISGRSEPLHILYDGSSAIVSVTVNRLDLGVTRTIRDTANRNGGFSAGQDGYNDRGAPILGRTDFSIIVANQFAAVNFGVNGINTGLNAGRKYYACTLMGYKESAAGTRMMEVACVFRAWGLWQGNGLGFKLYTEDPAQFGTLTLG
jgi:hypothetical protein